MARPVTLFVHAPFDPMKFAPGASTCVQAVKRANFSSPVIAVIGNVNFIRGAQLAVESSERNRGKVAGAWTGRKKKARQGPN